MQGRQQIRGFKEKVCLGQMLNQIKGDEHEQKSLNLVRKDHRKSKSTISGEWDLFAPRLKAASIELSLESYSKKQRSVANGYN